MIIDKTYQDLEFDEIRRRVSSRCRTESAQKLASKLEVLWNEKRLKLELYSVHEYKESLLNIPIPPLQAEEIKDDLKMLKVGDSVLSSESLRNIASLNIGVNRLISFFEKDEEELYPTLRIQSSRVVRITEIIDQVNKVLEPSGEVKSNASVKLMEIRKRQSSVRRQIERNFNIELAKYRDAGMLDDTKETFINGKRALAVKAEHKRQVSGQLLGQSSAGRIGFIEPAPNIHLNNELVGLEQDERDEIRRILLELTNVVRGFIPELKEQQRLLVLFDILQAKARYAIDIEANLPILSDVPNLEMHNAFHPLLLEENAKSGVKTFPQSVQLTPDKRLMVISGPNAGGKSITLKTVGLLQLMLQSGLLIPVDENSKCFLFESIMTDIGDNQSIENHLSTYSYRLKNMSFFLENIDRKTLLLIDEFGTGSDPELGGALAEVFFEEIYKKKSFGVLTTHYANIKVRADEMENAVNACMLFDEETLKPKFQLSVGQPGSSFTFEVAEMNGIASKLVGRAKTKVKGGKIKLDQSIAKIQKEKVRLSKLEEQLLKDKSKAEEAIENHDTRRFELEQKIERTTQLQEQNNQWTILGKKLAQWQSKYTGKNQKQVVGEIIKYIRMEYAKKQELAKKKESNKPRKPRGLASLDQKKAEFNEKKKKQDEWRMPVIGDKVKMDGMDISGTVVDFDKKKVVVNFGVMRTTIDPKKVFVVRS